MPTINEMRREISKCYTSSSWKNKVHMMDDNQVRAVYYDFIRRDWFRKSAEKQAAKKKKKEKNHQMTLGEYFGRDIFPI